MKKDVCQGLFYLVTLRMTQLVGRRIVEKPEAPFIAAWGVTATAHTRAERVLGHDPTAAVAADQRVIDRVIAVHGFFPIADCESSTGRVLSLAQNGQTGSPLSTHFSPHTSHWRSSLAVMVSSLRRDATRRPASWRRLRPRAASRPWRNIEPRHS